MTKGFIISGLLGMVILSGLYARNQFNSIIHVSTVKNGVKQLATQDRIHDGDLIFQTSLSEQSKAIQLATKSKYSHCGIIYKDGAVYSIMYWKPFSLLKQLHLISG